MVSFKAAAALMAFATFSNALPVTEPELVERQTYSSPPLLNQAAQAKGKLWFGSEIDTTSAEINDEKYMTIFNVSQVWGQTTPGNTMKWDYTEYEQGSFTLAPGQQTIDLAKATGKKVRCHNLVWYQEIPPYITNPTTPWTNATLLAAMEEHINGVVKGYGANCYSWDVVNEALNDDGTWRNNTFYEYIGPAYVPLAFRYASAAVKSFGGNVKLFYNDYNIEFPGAKTTAAVELVQSIKAYGAEIDGVGFESHFIVGETVSQSSYF